MSLARDSDPHYCWFLAPDSNRNHETEQFLITTNKGCLDKKTAFVC